VLAPPWDAEALLRRIEDMLMTTTVPCNQDTKPAVQGEANHA
jgi:hypothetical protein